MGEGPDLPVGGRGEEALLRLQQRPDYVEVGFSYQFAIYNSL